LLLAFPAYGHQMVPSHPVLKPSHVSGVLKTELELFNKRKDVEYYELGVFDADWNPIPFVSAYKVAHVRYLGHLCTSGRAIKIAQNMCVPSPSCVAKIQVRYWRVGYAQDFSNSLVVLWRGDGRFLLAQPATAQRW
jgi:hypothetical protein